MDKNEIKKVLKEVRISFVHYILVDKPETTNRELSEILGTSKSSITNYRKEIEKREAAGQPAAKYDVSTYSPSSVDEVLLTIARTIEDQTQVETEAEAKMDEVFSVVSKFLKEQAKESEAKVSEAKAKEDKNETIRKILSKLIFGSLVS